MAWNKNKSLQPAPRAITQFVVPGEKALSPGAPVVYQQGYTNQPYKDSWDVERAFEEGVRRVTWTFRAIDAIASNQARLPMILHKDNDPNGVLVKNDPLLRILNSTTNIGENSFVFRYRLSSQLLISTRGAFIEVIRRRDGEVQALHLLPPQNTAPIPDANQFVSGFEVELGNGEKKVLKPEDVIWLRRPHPLDPYLSLTPLEAAGIAVEVENLARLYNRNFLMNDGRGGGLLVINGEINEDDRRELIARHSGGVNRAGMFSVIASEDGAQYVDTGTNPREAAYVEMRKITKEEILAAFGVPESVIGNASGRTFSNAAEEGKVFWMETMTPHLEVIARALDALDDQYYVGFDTTKVPILILAEQDHRQFLMSEFNAGVTSVNEYREATGRKRVRSDLSDSLLINPNLTAIGNTKKKMAPNEVNPALENAPLDVQTGQTPILEFPDDVPTDGSAGQELAEREDVPNFDQFENRAEPLDELETKALDEQSTKVATETARWEEILGASLDRYFERQQRVVTEKAKGKKAQSALVAGKLSVETIFNQKVWDDQLRTDLRPIIQGIVQDAMITVGQKAGAEVSVQDPEVQEYVDAQIEQATKVNEGIAKDLAQALLVANAGDSDDGAPVAKTALLAAVLGALFLKVRKNKRDQMVDEEVLTSFNAGMYFGGQQTGLKMKRWVSREDSHVRAAHASLHGQKVEISEGFKVGNAVLRFPKDPLAPPQLTINCRCTLAFE